MRSRVCNSSIGGCKPNAAIAQAQISKPKIKVDFTPHLSAKAPNNIVPKILPIFNTTRKVILAPREYPAIFINLGNHVFTPYTISIIIAKHSQIKIV